jgi:hypothetical protein
MATRFWNSGLIPISTQQSARSIQLKTLPQISADERGSRHLAANQREIRESFLIFLFVFVREIRGQLLLLAECWC